MLYILTSIWVLCTLKAGQNLNFPCFCMLLQDFDAKIIKNNSKRAPTCLSQYTADNGREIVSEIYRKSTHRKTLGKSLRVGEKERKSTLGKKQTK